MNSCNASTTSGPTKSVVNYRHVKQGCEGCHEEEPLSSSESDDSEGNDSDFVFEENNRRPIKIKKNPSDHKDKENLYGKSNSSTQKRPIDIGNSSKKPLNCASLNGSKKPRLLFGPTAQEAKAKSAQETKAKSAQETKAKSAQDKSNEVDFLFLVKAARHHCYFVSKAVAAKAANLGNGDISSIVRQGINDCIAELNLIQAFFVNHSAFEQVLDHLLSSKAHAAKIKQWCSGATTKTLEDVMSHLSEIRDLILKIYMIYNEHVETKRKESSSLKASSSNPSLPSFVDPIGNVAKLEQQHETNKPSPYWFKNSSPTTTPTPINHNTRPNNKRKSIRNNPIKNAMKSAVNLKAPPASASSNLTNDGTANAFQDDDKNRGELKLAAIKPTALKPTSTMATVPNPTVPTPACERSVRNGNAPPKRSRRRTVTLAAVQPITAVLPLVGEDVPKHELNATVLSSCSLEDTNATPLPKYESKQYQSFELLSTENYPRDSHGIMQANPVGTLLDNPTNLASEHDGTLCMDELSQMNPDNRNEFQLDPPVFRWLVEKNLVKKCPRDVIYETRDTENIHFNPNQPRNEYVRLCQNDGFVPIDGSEVGYTKTNTGVVYHGVNYYAHVDGYLISCSLNWVRTTGKAREFMTSGTGDILAHRSKQLKTGCRHSFLVRTYRILSRYVDKQTGYQLAGLYDESATRKKHTVRLGLVILGTWLGPRPLGYIQQHDDRKDDDSLTNSHWLPRDKNNTTEYQQPE